MSTSLNSSGGSQSQVIVQVGPDGTVQFPNASDLFAGDFGRLGFHLQITGADGQQYLIENYFLNVEPGQLIAPNGAWLSGDHAAKLAGPRMHGFAQAGKQAATDTKIGAIGQVEKLDGGTATATRADGSKVQLAIGQVVYQGDVVETSSGAKLSIVFADRTVMKLEADSRMVLDQFNFTTPDANSNSMFFSALKGAFVFLTGYIAPSGNMRIDTPVATMGIRGTITGGDIQGEVKSTGEFQGTVNFQSLPDGRNPNGEASEVSLFQKGTNNQIGTIDGKNKFSISGDGTVNKLALTPTDLVQHQAASAEISGTYNAMVTRTKDSPTPLQGPPPPGASSGADQNNNGQDGTGAAAGNEQQQQAAPGEGGEAGEGSGEGADPAKGVAADNAQEIAVESIDGSEDGLTEVGGKQGATGEGSGGETTGGVIKLICSAIPTETTPLRLRLIRQPAL